MEPRPIESEPVDHRSSNRASSRWYALGSLVLVASIYVATLSQLPKDGFWIVDNGCKFIQMQSIIRSDYADYSIDWPGAKIDPEYKYSPLISRFGHVIDGKLYGTFAPFFPLISTFPYRAWGMAGLYVIPLAGGLLTLAAVWKLASILAGGQRGLRFSPALAIVLAGLATPIWFYSVEFWEHTPGTGLACWALVFFALHLRDSRTLWAALSGLSCAASIYFRDDLYVLAAVMGVGMVIAEPRKWRRGVLFGFVAAIALVPLWWFQWKVLGNPIGHHFAPTDSETVASGGFLMNRWLVVRHLFLDVGESLSWSILFTVPVLVLWLRKLVKRSDGAESTDASSFPLWGAFGIVGGSIVLYFQMKAASPPIWLLSSNSLFAASPFLVLAFVGARNVRASNGAPSSADHMIRVVLRMLLAYALIYAFLSPEVHANGVHWGCRYLLTLYPILAVIAAHNVFGWWKGKVGTGAIGVAVVGLLVVLSIVAQLHAVRLMGAMKEFRVRFNETISREAEDVIIADSWWIPMEASRCFDSQMIFLDRSPGEHAELRRRLYRKGIRKVTILRSPPRADAIERGHIVVHDSLGMFAAELETVRLP